MAVERNSENRLAALRKAIADDTTALRSRVRDARDRVVRGRPAPLDVATEILRAFWSPRRRETGTPRTP